MLDYGLKRKRQSDKLKIYTNSLKLYFEFHEFCKVDSFFF